MIKGVVFDMDGVLIDAKEWHYEALNRALALFGFEINRYAHLTTYDGLPTSRKLQMLSVEAGLPKELHSFINEMKQAYTMEIVHTQCKPMFVHEYALSNLEQLGYKLAVASNSIRPTVEVMMEKAHLTCYFDAMLSASDVRNPKPSPDIYLAAAERLGLKPEEILVVEDNENGIRAAKASGAHVYIVRDVTEVNFQAIASKIQEIKGIKA